EFANWADDLYLYHDIHRSKRWRAKHHQFHSYKCEWFLLYWDNNRNWELHSGWQFQRKRKGHIWNDDHFPGHRRTRRAHSSRRRRLEQHHYWKLECDGNRRLHGTRYFHDHQDLNRITPKRRAPLQRARAF